MLEIFRSRKNMLAQWFWMLISGWFAVRENSTMMLDSLQTNPG